MNVEQIRLDVQKLLNEVPRGEFRIPESHVRQDMDLILECLEESSQEDPSAKERVQWAIGLYNETLDEVAPFYALLLDPGGEWTLVAGRGHARRIQEGLLDDYSMDEEGLLALEFLEKEAQLLPRRLEIPSQDAKEWLALPEDSERSS